MDKILTIVVPTYNMEKYLDKCLTSLVITSRQGETLMKQLEVLVINDGSTDRSSEIAHGYEAKWPDTFRVIDKENGNYGSCVNRGLKEATGKYIKILDADDWFDTGLFINYLNSLKELDADLFLTNYCYINSDSWITSQKTYNIQSSRVLSINYLCLNYNATMHSITYRTQLLKDIDYVQTEGISYSDSEWSIIPMLHVKSFAYLNVCLYCYLFGRADQTCNEKVAVKKNKDFITTFTKIVNKMAEANQSSHVFKCVESTLLNIIESPYRVALRWDEKHNDEDLLQFDKFIKEKYPSMYKKLGEVVCSYGHVDIHYINEWRKKRLFYNKLPFRYRLVNKPICVFLELCNKLFFS